MSVVLDVNTISTTLWPTTTGKVARPTGQFLEVSLVDRGATRFTHVVFDPNDEATFYASGNEAVVYVFSLRRNSVKLFATLEYPITAMTCCANASSPLFLCATEDLTLIWVDCNTSRILRREKTPHAHVIHMMHAPAGFGHAWVATISRDTLVVWDVKQMVCCVNSGLTTGNTVHDFLSVHAEMNFILTVEHSGTVIMWDPDSLIKRKAVQVEMRPRAAAACKSYIAVGTSDAIVGLLRTEDLSSIGCVQVSTALAATRSLSIINEDLLVCELTDGTIVFVVVSSYSVAFAMTAPFCSTIRRSPSFFTVSGPSFGVFLRGEQLTVFHLPTSRQYYLRRTRWDGVNPNPTLPRQAYSFLRQGENTRALAPAQKERDDISDTTLPRPTIQFSDQQVSKWVKVDLLQKPSVTVTSTVGGGSHMCETSSNQFAAAGSSKLGKTRKGFEKNEVHNNNTSSSSNNNEKELSQRPFLDKTSQIANMKKLGELLKRYGVFPSKFRPLIWRFILQLPERRFTAPQYTQLLTKGVHKYVPSLMKPFPLTHTKLQTAMEKVLSLLVWHAPMFAVIHFLPMIVYPFLQVYGDDIQSTVEVVLVVLSNWGKEFFEYYPHHPVGLTTLMNHLLRTEDLELHSHLEQCGVMVQDWCWEVVKCFCTDILTSSAWLQVMDHAFFNRPLWFFLFYIRWIVNMREELMKLHEYEAVAAFLSVVHPVDVSKVIAETYRLYGRFPKGELTKPYSELHSFINYAYPVEWKSNSAIINCKLSDLQMSLERKEHAKEVNRHIHDIHKQVSEAEALEEMRVEKMRAEVAAQLTTKNDSLKNEVTWEKENQRVRDMKDLARIQTVQQNLQRADRLEAIHEELVSTRHQVTDLAQMRDREVLHWKRAESLTDHELRRLEDAARERLAKAMQAIQEEEEKEEKKEEEKKGNYEQPQRDGNSSRDGNPTLKTAGASAPTTPTTSAAAISVPTVPLPASSETSRPPGNDVSSTQAYRMMQNCVTRGVNETTRLPSQQGNTSAHQQKHLSRSSSHRPPSPHFLPSPMVAPSSHLYDNLLDYNTSKTSSDMRRTSNRDELSSAGTVLIRSRSPTAYRLPRPPQ